MKVVRVPHLALPCTCPHEPCPATVIYPASSLPLLTPCPATLDLCTVQVLAVPYPIPITAFLPLNLPHPPLPAWHPVRRCWPCLTGSCWHGSTARNCCCTSRPPPRPQPPCSPCLCRYARTRPVLGGRAGLARGLRPAVPRQAAHAVCACVCACAHVYTRERMVVVRLCVDGCVWHTRTHMHTHGCGHRIREALLWRCCMPACVPRKAALTVLFRSCLTPGSASSSGNRRSRCNKAQLSQGQARMACRGCYLYLLTCKLQRRCVHVCVHMRMHVCEQVHMCVCMHVHTCVCVHVCIFLSHLAYLRARVCVSY